MHAVFIPYGGREWVERFLRQVESQWFQQTWTKGKQKKLWAVKSIVRTLPLGAYEVVFPREYKDVVCSTLNFDTDRYKLGLKLPLLRKLYRCKKPKFEKTAPLLWFDEITGESVNIVPIGIREDIDIEDPKQKGWTHEGL